MSSVKCLVIPEGKRDEWNDALSDVLCWLDGFKAGGGSYSPGTENVLRDIKESVARAYTTTPRAEVQK